MPKLTMRSGDLAYVVIPKGSLGLVATRDPFCPDRWGAIGKKTLAMIISERWPEMELGPRWTHVVLDPVSGQLCLIQGDYCLVPLV